MRIIGVTGTDTGVGKTYVTAAIARALRARGLRVAALKPVASGVPADEVASDAAEIGEAAGHEPRVFASFEAPLSPHRAAALVGRSVDRDDLIRWIRQFDADVVLVEGAGGLRTPLGDDTNGWYFLDDLAPDAMVVVAPNRLGVLSQATLVVGVVLARMPLLGLFLNHGVGSPDDPSREYNETDLRHILGAVPLVAVTTGDGPAEALTAWAASILPELGDD